MKGSAFLRIVAAVMFTAVCAYLGAGLYPALAPGEAAEAAPVFRESPTRIALEGIALRDELPLPEDAVLPALAGLRLSASETAEFAGGSGSGIYMAGCDGLEALRLESALPLSVESVSALLEEEGKARRQQGRLVRGFDWHFAALCEYGEALPRGEYGIIFDGFGEVYPARLIQVSRGLDGRQALLFRLQLGDTEYLSLRRCRAELIVD